MADNVDGGAAVAAGGGAADLLGGGAAAAAGGAGGADGGTGAAGAAAEGGGADGGQHGQQGQQGGAVPDWYNQVSPDLGEGEKASLRDWLQAANVKDINGLAKIARDSQAALRESGRVKIPGEGASAEEVAAYHKAIGVPDSPQGYEFKAPVGEDGQPIQLNEGMLKRIAESSHKLGLPKGAAETLVSDFIQGELDDFTAAEAERDTQAEAWVKAQGAQKDAKIAAINRAAEALGLTREDMNGLRVAWGPEKALNLMSRLGEGMGEDVMASGGRARFTGTNGAEAKAELARLKSDPAWVAAATKPGTAENARYNRLNEQIGAAADREAAAAG